MASKPNRLKPPLPSSSSAADFAPPLFFAEAGGLGNGLDSSSDGELLHSCRISSISSSSGSSVAAAVFLLLPLLLLNVSLVAGLKPGCRSTASRSGQNKQALDRINHHWIA